MADGAKLIARHDQLKAIREPWLSLWREVAPLVLPRQDDFFRSRSQADKRTAQQFDARAARALEKFVAVLNAMLTPRSNVWHKLKPKGGRDESDPAVRWLEEVNERLWRLRYSPVANFASQQDENYFSLGAFGTSVMFVDSSPTTPLRYRSCHLSEIVFAQDAWGSVDTVHREFELTAANAVQMFDPARLPEKIHAKAKTAPDELFTFIHCTHPNDEPVYGKQDAQGMPWASAYVSLDDKAVVGEGGYRSFPYMVSRYTTAPREQWGRSPAISALPDIKLTQEMAKTTIRQAHQAVDPPWLMHDDSILSVLNARPGAMNRGGVSAEGRPLVMPLVSGARFDVAEEYRQSLYANIDDFFLSNLIQLLVDKPNMTATEVLQRAREQGWLLAPIMGRQQSESLGPLMEREFDLAMSAGALPPMPPEMLETGGEYEIEYDSPLSVAAKAEQGVAIARWIEGLLPVAQFKPDVLDKLNEDEIADILAASNGVPLAAVNTDDYVAQVRQQRAQQQAAMTAMQAAKPLASAVKDVASVQQAA